MEEQNTKKKILDVAEHLFSEKGISATSLRKITSGAGTNLASIHYHFGSKEEVFQKIFSDNIDAIDAAEFENKKVIVKGCGHIKLTEALYIAITKKLQNIVSSLMFGEACSAVPVFKKK